LYLRVACFVLFGWATGFSPPAHGQSIAQPRDTASPFAPPPGDAPPAPGPPPLIAPTGGYTPLSTDVHASPGAPPFPPVGPPPHADTTPALPAPAGALDLRDRRYADAHVDRVVLVPTAETHPEGTFYLTSYEIVLLQAGYAISDRTQVTLTSMPPLPKEQIVPLDLSLKTVLVRAPQFRIAAIGSASGIAGLEEGTALLGRVGGVVQLCLERTCGSNVSIASSVALAGPAIIAGNGAGLILRATKALSVLIEFDAVIPLGTAINQLNGLAFASGIRLSGEHLGLDLAIARRIDVLDGGTVPFLAATYRTGH
jgi:hypothetical protein